jgi:hypothetical protein
LSLVAPAGFAQQAPAASASQPKAATAKSAAAPVIPAGVRDVLDTLANVPPEFYADALLLLAESNQKIDRATKLKFIHEAIEQATVASAPVKKTGGVMLLSTDNEPGRSRSAYDLNLDRVSLLSRAIIDIAALDPPEARRLGNEMRLPAMPVVGCKEALVYDVKPYYTTLQVLARDRRHTPGTPRISTADLLPPAVSQLQTHTQVPLVLHLLSESNLSPDELETLTGLFIEQLGRLRDDERGFAAEMLSSSSTIDQLRALYQKIEPNHPALGLALLRESRRYLVENYRMGGCGQLWKREGIVGASDNGSLLIKIQDLRKTNTPSQQPLPENIQRFNDAFHDALNSSALGAIQLKEIDVDTPDVEAEQHKYWAEPDAAALLLAAQRLRFDDKDQERSELERESSTWRSQAISFLGKVDDWEADPFRSVEVLQEKNDLYQSVIDLAPQEDLRWSAIEKSLAMVEHSGLESKDPAAWMYLALSVRLRVSLFEKSRQKSAVNPKLTKRFLNSSNMSLRLIGYLDALGIDPRSSGPLKN